MNSLYLISNKYSIEMKYVVLIITKYYIWYHFKTISCIVLCCWTFILAQVHHIVLNDIQARGYVRPFCISYVTSDPMWDSIIIYLYKLPFTLSLQCPQGELLWWPIVRRPSCVCPSVNNFTEIFSLKLLIVFWPNFNRNDSWLAPYQSCSNGSDWLHL